MHFEHMIAISFDDFFAISSILLYFYHSFLVTLIPRDEESILIQTIRISKFFDMKTLVDQISMKLFRLIMIIA